MVRLKYDKVTISAAHIIEDAGMCSRLHGHNFRVSVVISIPGKVDKMVVDVKSLKQYFSLFDHKTLIPERYFKGELTGLLEKGTNRVPVKGLYHFQVGKDNLILPPKSVVMLPKGVNHTTMECLSTMFAMDIGKHLATLGMEGTVEVTVEESEGSSAMSSVYTDALIEHEEEDDESEDS